MVHCGAVRQTASIVAMEQDHLRAGDKSHIVMRFAKCPEYLHVGARLIFREGRTKAVGTITRVIETPQKEYLYPAPAPAPASASASTTHTPAQEAASSTAT
jgi:hypothetical protein